MKFPIIALSLFSLLAFSACKKEVTEIIREVKQAYSAIYTIKPADWKLSSTHNRATVTLPVPELDEYMRDNGAVLVYINFNGEYEALPETYNGLTYTVSHDVGNVYIDVYEAIESEHGTVTSLPNVNLQAKVVLIDADPLD